MAAAAVILMCAGAWSLIAGALLYWDEVYR